MKISVSTSSLGGKPSGKKNFFGHIVQQVNTPLHQHK